jgi:hypothetical protein
MHITRVLASSGLLASLLTAQILAAAWEPPAEMTREAIIEASRDLLARPDIPITVTEDIFRIRAVEMDWDGAGAVYQPTDPSRIPAGADGKKVGLFMIHGGGGDQRGMDKTARFLATKLGFKVVTMSYPGALYLLNESHDWPGRAMKEDGSVRTPMYTRETVIDKSQYDIVEDKSMRPKYGTLILACAKEGTEFYHRKAGWPVAFEEIGKSLMQRHLPPGEFSIYIHGHSTGGPFANMFTQRVENIRGLIGMDSSPFGYVFRKQSRESGNTEGKTYGDVPFNCMQVRTWRDRARYAGVEALMTEGPDALKRLPMLMEEVLGDETRPVPSPSFKNEGMVHFGAVDRLAEAARATAQRLKLSPGETEAMVARYVGYARELSGPGVKPVPPILFGIAAYSADHTPERYQTVTLPTYAAMKPPPKTRLVQFKAGTHGYTAAEPDLPMGVLPAAARLWHDAIMNGYYTGGGTSN